MDKVKAGKLIFKICLWIIAGILFAYVLLIGFLLFVPKLKSYVNQTAFESTQWKLHLSGQDIVKQKMVDDLLSKHQLVGMTKANIDELLGTPPRTNYFQDYDYVYWLGPERSALGIDSEWLGIKFDRGVVIKAENLRD